MATFGSGGWAGRVLRGKGRWGGKGRQREPSKECSMWVQNQRNNSLKKKKAQYVFLTPIKIPLFGEVKGEAALSHGIYNIECPTRFCDTTRNPW